MKRGAESKNPEDLSFAWLRGCHLVWSSLSPNQHGFTTIWPKD